LPRWSGRRGASLQQALDNVDRFGEALMSSLRRSPEPEAPVHQEPNSSRALRDDRWMVAHGRAGDRCHQSDPIRGIGNRPQHGPGKRRVPLLFDPREEVIRDRREIKASLLGQRRVFDQLLRPSSSDISL
jgi:hypothetical protein